MFKALAIRLLQESPTQLLLERADRKAVTEAVALPPYPLPVAALWLLLLAVAEAAIKGVALDHPAPVVEALAILTPLGLTHLVPQDHLAVMAAMLVQQALQAAVAAALEAMALLEAVAFQGLAVMAVLEPTAQLEQAEPLDMAAAVAALRQIQPT